VSGVAPPSHPSSRPAPDETLRGRAIARFGQRYLVALDSSARGGLGADGDGPGTGSTDGAAAGAADGPADGAADREPVDAVVRGRRLEVVVGDRVRCSRASEPIVIESVEARRNVLYRADANRIKPLAANVDQVAIVFAAQPPPQPEFVWRALLAAGAAGIGAMAILNKVDLPSEPVIAALDELGRLGARVVRVSARADPEGTRALLDAQCRGRVTLFVGQSGMGKSTLLNLLVGPQLRTGALSRRGTHGRQTTTATHWFSYGADGAVIDSPGFHEFGLAHLEPKQLLVLLPEFTGLTRTCRFADCRHMEEPDCAVREAVGAGLISPARYAFYRRLLEPSAPAQAPRRR
jgi:ribosome biogenesis GTPase